MEVKERKQGEAEVGGEEGEDEWEEVEERESDGGRGGRGKGKSPTRRTRRRVDVNRRVGAERGACLRPRHTGDT